ncbi:hypothetical protein G4Z16_12620 [Streptomyces bathyalis]|uniref:Uncharacterized protein n=1 Tax=Streptomyces bathyalis TaxID=2710756 RepID=A0A7T1WSG3_9ACTN|nr:hypothetical protein [Streptomyces bathyalis]QPP07092.1 hypothetical protein G4Z16_12620 [Streptomyces bathyalis]
MDDEDALEAVRRHLDRRGELTKAGPPDTWKPAPLTLVKGRIVRSIENRAERPGSEPGDFDLSERPRYDDLDGYHLDPPRNPAEPMELRLVKRDSESSEPCSRDCDRGRTRCGECRGRKRLRCEPRTDCEACAGENSCLNCAASGGTAGAAGPDAARPARTEKRLTCVKCGERGVACRSCQGRGDVPCALCEETGFRDCPTCRGSGTVRHDDCKGTGRFTVWTAGTITRKPETGAIRRPEHSVSWHTWNKARRHGSWRTEVLSGDAGTASVADLDDEAAKGLAPDLTKKQGEVAREVTLEILRLTRVEVPLLPHRVHYAHPAPATHPSGTVYEVFAVPSGQRVLQIAVAALGALAVLTLVWWLLTP